MRSASLVMVRYAKGGVPPYAETRAYVARVLGLLLGHRSAGARR